MAKNKAKKEVKQDKKLITEAEASKLINDYAKSLGYYFGSDILTNGKHSKLLKFFLNFFGIEMKSVAKIIPISPVPPQKEVKK